MRHNQKSKLTKYIKSTTCSQGEEDPLIVYSLVPSNSSAVAVRHVLDGGYLLHVVQWPVRTAVKCPTFGDLCEEYVQYTMNKYKSPVVVFDGYDTHWSTKCEEQMRRNRRKKPCPTLTVRRNEEVRTPREEFLSNIKNKSNFITLLKEYFVDAGFEVKQADSDGDTLTVKIALDL